MPMTIKSKIKSFIKERFKDFAFDFYFPRIYSKAAKKVVVENKVVFVEAREKSMPDSYKVIYHYLRDGYKFDLHLTLLKEGWAGFINYYRNCVAMLRQIATAKYVFLNDASSIISCVKLRPETSVIQLWHACGAFKKWGMSTADLKFGGSREEVLKHPFYKNLSLVTVSSSEVIWAYAEAMVLEDRQEIIQALGVSRTDVFFDDDFTAKARTHVEEHIPECVSKKIILYAPTFRGGVASAQGPDELDVMKMHAALGSEYVLLIRHHPFVKNIPHVPEGCGNFAFLTDSSIAIDELLCVADICITDYSSLVFEYSLFARPMIFFAYDLDDYNDWRGFYYDYDELTPGPVYKTTQEIIRYIEKIEIFDDREVLEFRNRFMNACDGQATKRICETVFGDDLCRYAKSKTHKALDGQNPIEKNISIIIPAYNAMPELSKGLQSIVDQTYDLHHIEAIVVDDGSNDSTWEEIQRFVSLYPDLFVGIKLSEPSGSPAKPRNKALDVARGEYIFFLDADDWLGSEAVEKMLAHAVSWGSDVLFVKMKGENGREVPQSMFTHDQPEVDLYKSKVLWSIGPLKLYRRSLLEENNLRFFEEGMPEDLHLVLPALVEAKIISVASDYDYYHVCWRVEEKRNTSLSIWDDLESNLVSYGILFDFIKRRTPRWTRDRVLMRRLFRRDIYNMLISLVENYQDEEQEKLYSRVVDMFSPYYRKKMFKTASFDKRVVLDAGMSGNLKLLKHVVQAKESIYYECAFRDTRYALYYRLDSEEGAISGEITKSLVFTCQIDEVKKTKVDSVGVKGVSTISKSIILLPGETQLNLILRKKNSFIKKIFPCKYHLRDNEFLDENMHELKWHVILDFSLIDDVVGQAHVGSQWYFYMRVSGRHISKEVRLGLSDSIGVELAFRK